MSAGTIARYNGPTTLLSQLQLAEELAKSSLLPDSFRQRPANVLWSIEYAKTLNISVLAAVTGVHVMDGKPTASAGLMTALVRRAGHKVRTRTTGTVAGGDFSATCTIIRYDDPDNPFTVTWDLDRALRAELIDRLDVDEQGRTIVVARTQKDKAGNWQKYTETMCKHRATSECARDAAEDALFGLHYTPEELGAEVDFTADGHTIVTGEVLPDGDEPGDDPKAWRAAITMARIALDERDPLRLLNGYGIAEQQGLLDWDISTVLSDEDEIRAELEGNHTLGALIRLMGLRRKAELTEREERRRAAMEKSTVDAEVVPDPQDQPAAPVPAARAGERQDLTALAERAAELAEQMSASDDINELTDLWAAVIKDAKHQPLVNTDIARYLNPDQAFTGQVDINAPVPLGKWAFVCRDHLVRTGDSINTAVQLATTATIERTSE